MSIKQVIVMRTDLGMRKGKMIAQGAHASMAVLLREQWSTPAHLVETLSPTDAIYRNGRDPYGKEAYIVGADRAMMDWLTGLFTKVCLRADSEELLLDLHRQAQEAKIPCSLITDAGLTEFGGVPTNTCIAIGPADSEDIDRITGGLKLL